MSTVYWIAYHGLAAVAMLAHLVLGGLLLLLTVLLSSPPETADAALLLKVISLLSWLGLGWLGLRAWRRQSWLVVVMPLLYFAVLWVVNSIGSGWVHWFLNWGDPYA